MWRIIFGIVMIVASTAVAWKLSLRYTKRREFFYDFHSFHQLMQREVSFAKSTLREIFAKAKYGVAFTQLLRQFENREEPKSTLLTARENEYVKSYFQAIGRTDSVTQLAFLNAQKAVVEKYMNESREEESKYKPLYLKLGLLIGLILFVVVL